MHGGGGKHPVTATMSLRGSLTQEGGNKTRKTEETRYNDVRAQLDKEMAGPDDGRPRRYVATVRPAMATLRYKPPETSGNGWRRSRSKEGGSDATSIDAVASWGASSTEEDTDSETVETSEEVVQLGNELNVNMLAGLGSTAKRQTRAAPSDEVTMAVAALDVERPTRRQRQGDDAHADLAQRRRQQAEGVQTGGERTQVRLVQQAPGSTTTGTTGTDAETNVTANDGLPAAVMYVDGEKLAGKLTEEADTP
ncbi:hypothetical protein PC119_g21263 [Phytophthora cactorum]|nr:hypothetical protein PC119_g21263 [Phytophthora cactorum]KAG3139598.1 hypothetical protein C6341_g20296 [Phytophthora cactorum]